MAKKKVATKAIKKVTKKASNKEKVKVKATATATEKTTLKVKRKTELVSSKGKKKVVKKVEKKQETVAQKKVANPIPKKTDEKVSLGVKTNTTVSERKTVNIKVPQFKLYNSKNEVVTNESLTGKKIVLYFYPKDNTPGCTLEGQQFARMHKEFVKLNCEIFGVSKDSVQAHDKFKCKYNFPFELLADVDGVLCDAFDVIKEKNMYGKKFMGIERSTFILDEHLNVLREFRKINLAGHAEFILEELKKL